MKQINATLIPIEFIDEHLKDLDGSAVKVFLFIARHTYGDMDETRPVKKIEIAERIGLSEKSVYNALKELTDKQLVMISRKKGRGACNGYRVNNARQTLPGNNYQVIKGALHGSENPIDFKSPPVVESPEPAPPVASATPSHLKKLPHLLIEMCDKLNRIPRTQATFAREMKSSKEVVNSVIDILTHNGSDDYSGALGWIVKMAQNMKSKGHWYLKAKSVKPSTIHYCLDEIITEIETEKKRREKAKESDEEYVSLTKRTVIA